MATAREFCPVSVLNRIMDKHLFEARAKGLSLVVGIDESMKILGSPEFFLDTFDKLIEAGIHGSDEKGITVSARELPVILQAEERKKNQQSRSLKVRGQIKQKVEEAWNAQVKH